MLYVPLYYHYNNTTIHCIYYTYYTLYIPCYTGSFRMFQALLHPRNITEFSYRLNNSKNYADVIFSVQAAAGNVYTMCICMCVILC